MPVNRHEIVAAINSRSVVDLRYEGEAPRLIQPHVLYRGAKGQELLDTYQVAGFTHTGPLPAWRHFSVDKITQFTILDAMFEIAPGYNPDSLKYRSGLIAFAR
ncbi:MAG: hypothetical protein ACJ757_13905 [Gaiellaceae bacterium]